MKRLLAAGLLALGLVQAIYAQDLVSTSSQSNRTLASQVPQVSSPSAAATFSRDPHSSSGPGDSAFAPLLVTPEPGQTSFFSRFHAGERLSLATPDVSATSPSDSSVASPAPYSYMGREFRMQLSLGFALVRFRSSAFQATAPGVNTSFSYFFKEWVAIDGSVTTAFAPPIYQNAHVKYLGYAAGPRATLSRGRWEPWAHALIGGVHVLPQIAAGGTNGFQLQLGGGTDYNLNPHFALRIEADWLRSNLFSQTQNSGQGVLALVYNF